ncbi:hypothetical protein [Oceanirhabdus seepicola]|uniref:Uncharacterized protein n=1 Tax=Oceanirhabdus seepicola TaxID=2828781 RepID=A0A9J6P0A3_9CLOT|nr:hypothetical protein [Oceanirhabdus seepicola]MCM1989788.1 hypothetical protein [Oceanirhabdus seepicola]
MINRLGAININKVEELKNNRVGYEEKLTGEYKKAYCNVRRYILGSSVLKIQKEEVMSDILEMFLDYQENNKDISSLLGGNHEEFCEKTIESLRTSRLGKIYGVIKWLEIFIVVMLVEIGVVFAFSMIGVEKSEIVDLRDCLILLLVGIFLATGIGKYKMINIYTPWRMNIYEFMKDLKVFVYIEFGLILFVHLFLKNIEWYLSGGMLLNMAFRGLILLFIVNIMKVIFAKGMKS